MLWVRRRGAAASPASARVVDWQGPAAQCAPQQLVQRLVQAELSVPQHTHRVVGPQLRPYTGQQPWWGNQRPAMCGHARQEARCSPTTLIGLCEPLPRPQALPHTGAWPPRRLRGMDRSGCAAVCPADCRPLSGAALATQLPEVQEAWPMAYQLPQPAWPAAWHPNMLTPLASTMPWAILTTNPASSAGGSAVPTRW